MATNNKKINKINFIAFLIVTILLIVFFLIWIFKSVTWQYNPEIYSKDTGVVYYIIFKYLFSISTVAEKIVLCSMPVISILALSFFKRIERESRFLIYGIIFIQLCTIGFMLYRIIDISNINEPKNKYINSKLIERRTIFENKLKVDSINVNEYLTYALNKIDYYLATDSLSSVDLVVKNFERNQVSDKNHHEHLIQLYDSISVVDRWNKVFSFYPNLSFIVRKINGSSEITNPLPDFTDNNDIFWSECVKLFDKTASNKFDSNLNYNWYEFFKLRYLYCKYEGTNSDIYYKISTTILDKNKVYNDDTNYYLKEYPLELLCNLDFSNYCRLINLYPRNADMLISKIRNFAKIYNKNEIRILLATEKELINSNLSNQYRQLGRILSNHIYEIESTVDSMFPIITLLWNPRNYRNSIEVSNDLDLNYLVLNEQWDYLLSKTENIEKREDQLGYAVLTIANKAKGDESKYNKYKKKAVKSKISNPGKLFLDYANYLGQFTNDSILFIAIKYIQLAKVFTDDIEYGGFLGLWKTKIYNKDFKVYQC